MNYSDNFSDFFARYIPIINQQYSEDPIQELYYDSSSFDSVPILEDEDDLSEIEQDVETGNIEFSEDTQKKPTQQSSNNNSSLGNKIVNTARQFQGVLYKWGGNDPSGFDCSGLIQYAYKQNGIKLPRTSHEMGRFGRAVSINNVQPGDIIYTGSRGPSGGHVKMVSKVENGKIFVIEASGRGKPVKEHELKQTNNIRSIRRVISSKKGSKLIPKYKTIKSRSN